MPFGNVQLSSPVKPPSLKEMREEILQEIFTRLDQIREELAASVVNIKDVAKIIASLEADKIALEKLKNEECELTSVKELGPVGRKNPITRSIMTLDSLLKNAQRLQEAIDIYGKEKKDVSLKLPLLLTKKDLGRASRVCKSWRDAFYQIPLKGLVLFEKQGLVLKVSDIKPLPRFNEVSRAVNLTASSHIGIFGRVRSYHLKEVPKHLQKIVNERGPYRKKNL